MTRRDLPPIKLGGDDELLSIRNSMFRNVALSTARAREEEILKL